MGLVSGLGEPAGCVGTADTEVCCKATTGKPTGPHGEERDHASNWDV